MSEGCVALIWSKFNNEMTASFEVCLTKPIVFLSKINKLKKILHVKSLYHIIISKKFISYIKWILFYIIFSLQNQYKLIYTNYI